jgi:DNA mismatch repair ATPase MutS
MRKKIEEIIEQSFDVVRISNKVYYTSKSKSDEKFKKRIEELLTLTDVVNCNCDESKQLEEEFEIKHLINDTYQVVGKESNTVWKQGTMEECNEWVML